MNDVIVRFKAYRAREREILDLCAIKVFAIGGFRVIEGECPAPLLHNLETEPIRAAGEPERLVLPSDGLIWAEALGWRYGTPYLMASAPEPA